MAPSAATAARTASGRTDRLRAVVVSHSILFPDGSKKTLGLIYPGKFHFGTDKAERREIVAGSCSVKLDGQTAVHSYGAGQAFDVPAKSGFDIEVTSDVCEYICSFLS